MTELPRALQSTVWPLGDHLIEELPTHPLMRAVGEALQPLRPLLRMLTYDLNDPMPVVTLGLGAEFHLISVRLIDEDTLMTDLPVGEVEQTAGNLQRLLAENLNRTWTFRVDSVSGDVLPRAVVVIEHRLPLTEMHTLSAEIIDGWIHKGLAAGLLRALRGEGDHL